jgi:hypothetical protein
VTRVCALINYFNDEDMLKLQVASGQLDHYDKVYIFDGPYVYTESLGLTSTSQKKLSSSDFGMALLRDDRYVYHWGVYRDEHHKRVHAYEQCDAEFIVLHDTDEFYAYDQNAYLDFIKSDRSVAYFYCQNLYLDGMMGTKLAITRLDELPWKGFLFRKSGISAKQHLDYLWLVGVEQHQIEIEKTFRQPVAWGYHLTQMRSLEGQRQKYLFYTSLYASRNIASAQTQGTDIRGELDTLVNTGDISIATARNIYMRGILGFVGAPDPESNIRLQQRMTVSEPLEEIISRAKVERNCFAPGAFTLYKGWPMFLYVEADRFSRVTIGRLVGRVRVRAYSYATDTAERPHQDFEYADEELEILLPAGVHGLLISVCRVWMSGEPALAELHIDAATRHAVA